MPSPGQAPFAFTPQVNYTTFAQIAGSGNNLVIGPSGPDHVALG